MDESVTMPRFSRALFLALALAGATALPGCARPSAEAADAAPANAPEPVAVETEPASASEVPKTLRLTGTLRGNREADVAANASGRVLRVSIERGDSVKLGQTLATLDVRAATLSANEARAQAASARAQEEQARDECGRYEKLKERGAISDLEFQQKLTQCRTLPLTAEAATARAALAAQNVGDGVIRAPFAGVVAERLIEVGQYVRQDTKVVTLVSLDPIRLELAVPEAEVAKVAEGAAVSFGVAAYPERRFSGKIRFVSGVVRASTRDLIVEAMVANPDRLLKPGMFADVELAVGAQTLPSVPKKALVVRNEQARVFVVAGGRLEERVLALGPSLGDRVSVLRGVGVGDPVVVSNPSQLRNGQAVQ